MYLPDTVRPQNKGYGEAGASWRKKAVKGFNAPSGSAHEDIDFNNYTLRQRARMLYMAAPIATSAIKTNRTNVVGVGLQLKSRIDREVLGLSADQAEAWQKSTEREFSLWAENKRACDATGMNTFYGLQQLALISWLLSGDCIGVIKQYKPSRLLPYSLRVHLIESDRIATPGGYGMGQPITYTTGKNPTTGNTIYDGVEVDSNGRVVAYHISNTYPHQITSEPQKWQRVEAYGAKTGLPNILHIMDSERPDQYRGVPYLAQVIEPLLQLRRYTESELMAALVQSFFTAWIETETDPSDTPFNEVGAGDIAGVPAEVNADGGPMANNISDDDNEYEMGPGTVTHLAPGEKVNFGNPNIPTAGFETFVKTLCKLVGAALELPYDVLIKEFNSSYSASRGALLEAWEAFKMRRKWFVDDFCQPVYEMFLAEAVALGRIKAPGFFTDPLVREAWCGARWIGPVQGSLDPKKEAEAALMLIDNAIKTHEQVSREMSGGDWEENVEQLQRENELLTQAGGNKVTVVSASPKEGDGDED